MYPIHFENIGDVEAIDVFIADVLDQRLDESTLEILTPAGSYDAGTRTVTWNLLDRDLQPGESDNVLYSIRPLLGLPSGTEIRNSAEIQFEIFEPLVTPEVVNIIDDIEPVCDIQALPATTQSEMFPIFWNGTDEVGEIDHFTVFVSEDGGLYRPFVTETEDVTAMFVGEEGRRYDFLCVAVDTAGNAEEQDLVAEASTRVALDSGLDGDLDGDGDVDRDDLAIILAARNTPADGTDDPRDRDGDGTITGLDARQLTLLCTRPNCATQ